MNEYELGFVGVGVMASAIIKNVLKSDVCKKGIIIYDIDERKIEQFKGQAVDEARSASEIFERAKISIICVKPQVYKEILNSVTQIKSTTVVSIMAGVKIATLRLQFSPGTGIVRVMPNMPCKIGLGMTAICADDVVSLADLEIVKAVFGSCGRISILSESKFDAVTSISGSGPAYVYMFIDGLIKGGMAGGLTYEESKELVIQTLNGSAELARYSNETMEALVEKVCSKGGTTIEAVDYFREHRLIDIIENGVKKCREKSKLLSDKF
ncbi:MAG: pyrroline-5-carboxylate reductase [Christensenellaceae bacterium]|jgi:pyrroline-5-carboxylate reductase|nr:pyrroline-5-carboxylate reductase [Christensenellaceae bacterium]